jgi:hypothetical protein
MLGRQRRPSPIAQVATIGGHATCRADRPIGPSGQRRLSARRSMTTPQGTDDRADRTRVVHRRPFCAWERGERALAVAGGAQR